jgi:hypothetical protein
MKNKFVDNLHTRFKTEDKITALVKDYLESQDDIKATKISDRYKKGVSDFIANVGGVFVAIELKADKGTASPHQEEYIEENIQVGGIGGVCYTLAEVIHLISLARKKINP